MPHGQARLRMALGGLRAVCDDIVGTISPAQCRQIKGTMSDFERRRVPKMTPATRNILLTKDQGKDLLDCARWKCHDCVEDGEQCRQCRLYQILEATTPMDDYGDGLVCPYALAEWEE